jgi:RNase H-fold protein (predicted Holliday junction resolvase)
MSKAKAIVDTEPKSEQWLTQLEELLTQQIQSAQHDDFLSVVEASNKAGEVVDSIVGLKLLETKENEHQRRRIEKLYRKLSIIIDVEKQYTMEQLMQLRSGSRLLNAYKSNA